MQSAVYSVSSSKHSPYKGANEVWSLDWEEFLSVLDWVNMCSAAEQAVSNDSVL